MAARFEHARKVQLGRQRLLGDRRERPAHHFALCLIRLDAVGDINVVGEVGNDLAAPALLQRIIDVRLQFVLGDRAPGHLILRRYGRRAARAPRAPAPPSRIRRNLSRPRASRDMTVPIGTASTSAVSA